MHVGANSLGRSGCSENDRAGADRVEDTSELSEVSSTWIFGEDGKVAIKADAQLTGTGLQMELLDRVCREHGKHFGERKPCDLQLVIFLADVIVSQKASVGAEDESAAGLMKSGHDVLIFSMCLLPEKSFRVGITARCLFTMS